MRLAHRTGSTFDLLSLPETNTSIVRNQNEVRLTWVDADGRYLQLIKQQQATSHIGCGLVSCGRFLKPTGDNMSKRTVAKLLATPGQAVKTKQVDIDGTMYTARLLPVQML